MNKNLVILGVLGLVAVGGVGVYKLSSSQKTTPPAETAPAETSPPQTNKYPQEVKDNFVKSCAAAGGQTDVCECVINKIEEIMTFQEFYEVDREMAETGTINPLIEEAALSCKK